MNPANAQQNLSAAECPLIDMKGINLRIPGSTDTTFENGTQGKIIDPATLINGFKLIANDPSVLIENFRLTVDESDKTKFTLYAIDSRGDSLPYDSAQIPTLLKLSSVSFFTIDNIFIRYKGKCYRLPGQYYVRR